MRQSLLGLLVLGLVASFDVRDTRLGSGCMDVPFSICLGKQNKKRGEAGGPIRLNKDYQQKGLVGLWNFDDILAQDHTGNMNPVYPKPKFGPGFISLASGYFNGTTLHYVSHLPPKPQLEARIKQLNAKNKKAALKKANKNKDKKKKKEKWPAAKPPKSSKTAKPKASPLVSKTGDVTIAFWVYLLSDAVGQFRTLLYRGDADTTGLHIQLWPEVRRVHVRVSTGIDPITKKYTHISMDTHSSVLIGRWTHIAFVVQGGRLVQLYVNGVLDTQKLSLQPVQLSLPDDRIFIANNPFVPSAGIACYLDQLTIYNRALARAEVTAMGSVVFPGLDANSIKLGCATCTLEKAIASCKASKGTHLCASSEINGSGLIVARAMGWVSSMNQHVFASDEKPLEAKNGEPVLGVGLCCRDFS